MVIARSAATDAAKIDIGDDVFTFDGVRLGTVKASKDGSFKVHCRWARDYWLTSDLVHDCTPGRTTLFLPRAALDSYKIYRSESARNEHESRARPSTPRKEMERWLQGSAPNGTIATAEKVETPSPRPFGSRRSPP